MFDRCLYFNTKQLARIVDTIWKDAFFAIKLSPSHAYLIRLVIQRPGLLQKEIGSILHLEKSTVTRFIDKMVKQGYLSRKKKIIEDTRYHYIYPTNKARNITSELESIGNDLYHQMQNTLSTDELELLVGLLKKSSNKF